MLQKLSYPDYLSYSFDIEHEALRSSNRERWKQDIQLELDSIKKNYVWDIVSRPKYKMIIGTRWVLKIKVNSSNLQEKFKGRLVAKGYDHICGINYYKTFAPVIKLQSLRTFLAITANSNLKVHQIDIDNRFLNFELNEAIYIEPPIFE